MRVDWSALRESVIARCELRMLCLEMNRIKYIFIYSVYALFLGSIYPPVVNNKLVRLTFFSFHRELENKSQIFVVRLQHLETWSSQARSAVSGPQTCRNWGRKNRINRIRHLQQRSLSLSRIKIDKKLPPDLATFYNNRHVNVFFTIYFLFNRSLGVKATITDTSIFSLQHISYSTVR